MALTWQPKADRTKERYPTAQVAWIARHSQSLQVGKPLPKFAGRCPGLATAVRAPNILTGYAPATAMAPKTAAKPWIPTR